MFQLPKGSGMQSWKLGEEKYHVNLPMKLGPPPLLFSMEATLVKVQFDYIKLNKSCSKY